MIPDLHTLLASCGLTEHLLSLFIKFFNYPHKPVLIHTPLFSHRALFPFLQTVNTSAGQP